MSAKVYWLFAFVLLYWAYCIFWGIKSARLAKTASDYFIAGRQISLWVFVLAATATSFSGLTFMGHPGLVYRDGFQYAYASFYTITIPFTGVMFLKRQWMLGKRYGYVTPPIWMSISRSQPILLCQFSSSMFEVTENRALRCARSLSGTEKPVRPMPCSKAS